MTYIQSLDEALAAAGTPVTLVRNVANTPVEISVRAAVRVVNKLDPNLAGSKQEELHFVISPTEITAANWPGQASSGTGYRTTDPRIPVNGDKIYYNGMYYLVEYTNAIRIGGELVRMEVYAKGNIAGA